MKAWRDVKNLPRELWILNLATLVNRLGTMALPFLVLYLTRSLGFSAETAGGVLALYGAVGLVVGPVAGKLSDCWGAVRVMETTLIASGIVLLVFPLVQSLAGVIVMTILFSATNEAFRPSNYTLVGELAPPEHRKTSFAFNRFAINLGMSIGPTLGGFLAQRSFPLLFLVDGVTTLAAAMILVFSPFRKKALEHLLSVKSTSPLAKSWVLDAIFSDSSFRLFLLGILPVSIVFFQHESSMALYIVRDLHLNEADYGLLFTFNTLLIIFLEIPLNSATSHWSHRRTLALGSLLFAVGFGALAFAENFLGVAITVVIWTFGEMILFPGMSAYVTEAAPRGRSGEYMGLYLMTFSLAFILGPLIGTHLLETIGAKSLWFVMLGVGMISVLLLGLTPKSRKTH